MRNDGRGERRRELIARAASLVRQRALVGDSSAGAVGAALLTADGNVYTGVCVDLPSGLGFCAEVAAAAAMVTAGETRVEAVVAVTFGEAVLPPCGRCRETLSELDEGNLECAVVLGPDREVPLRELLPERWRDARPGPR